MRKYLALFLAIFCLSNCQNENNTNSSKVNEYNIIPMPVSLKAVEGQFVLNKNTTIVGTNTDEAMNRVAQNFIQEIEQSTGYKYAIQKEKSPTNSIVFEKNEQLPAEGYSLSINADRVHIKAKKAIGFFYAIQSINQLLPTTIAAKRENNKLKWSLPSVEILDHPRFVYRGMHLDVSRHFHKVNKVKKFIDQLAFHKLNYFHWHLTDDQGWRIEIKKYPKLTEVGAFRNGTLIGHYNDQPHQFDNKRYGGFYTQEEIKEVVQYAADRFITVVPEIELPGHAQAAITAYPELGCHQDPLEVLQKWGVSENIFCPKEATFSFLEDVLDEVIALFPGKYIHIGGDECPKTQWEESAFCQQLMRKEGLKDGHELQSYFIRRIEKYINSKGRQIIGWDEILEGGLAPNATVMSWRGIEGGIEAAKAGHDVVMTPTGFCYFDYYQSDHPDEPLAIGGFIPLEKVYSYEPIPEELNASEAKFILGAQANVWTEYMPSFEKVEYMMFPRLCALAEVVWSQKETKNFEQFISRLSPHINRLEAMDINTANHLYDLNSSIAPVDGKVEVALNLLAKDADIYYSLNNSEPTMQSTLYKTPITVDASTVVKAQAFLNGEKKGRGWEQFLEMHKAAGKKINLLTEPHAKYSAGGHGAIINGVLGSSERYGDAEWLGFDGKDFEAIIDLGKEETISSVDFRFFKGEGQWIYLPKSVQILSSNDGESFTEVETNTDINGDSKVIGVKVPVKEINTRFLKIIAKNYGLIPKGKQGGGHEAWLFIDEISVN